MDYNKPNNIIRGKLSKLMYNKETNDDERYELMDIDNPSGWNFTELDMLGEIGFTMEDDYTLMTEIELTPWSLEEIIQNEIVRVYKNKEGYILENKRKYVFESFGKMINFIESVQDPNDRLDFMDEVD